MHKKELNDAICSNVDGPRDYHTKSERETQIPYDVTYMWNLKRIQMNLFTKQTHRFGKQTSGSQKVKLVGQG